jgi:hypothetical protein
MKLHSSPIYILIDFSCGRFYTHHSSYLKDYACFIESFGLPTEIWVNDSADKEMISDLSNYTVRPILKSNMYGMQRRQNLSRFAIQKFLNIFFKLLLKIKTPKIIIELLKIYCSNIYLRSTVKEIKFLESCEREIVLIFPTLDALGLRLIKNLSRKDYNKIVRICARVTGAEKRGIFAVSESEKTLVAIKNTSNFALNLGYEVEIYKEKFIGREFLPPYLHWAPMPAIERISWSKVKRSNSDEKLNLGFLGSARSGKGFENIPVVLEMLRRENLKFHAFIQKPIFEWKNSENVIKTLNDTYKSDVTWIAGGVSRERIDQIICDLDLLFLPYDSEQYRYAGSGLLFIASDYLIPVITSNQVAFAWDVINFQIGLTYENFESVISELSNFNKETFTRHLKTYNSQRNIANQNFLGLDSIFLP